MSLKEYTRKRDFRKTAEPPAAKGPGNQHRFVIQKHAASHLHYDFRLELDGTLKSWAVPKNIPLAKGEKRLAVQVEDHPVSYINFEGTIPKGQYGGGTVMVWDRGTFEPGSATPLKDLAGGKLHFTLHGKKLAGEWYLVQLRGGKQWLLIRGGPNLRPISKKQEDTSALSGKSMKQLAGSGQVWQSNHASGNGQPPPARAHKAVRRPAEKIAAAGFIEPMKAKLVETPPTGDWVYEIKFDGFRALGIKMGNQVQLLSRNEKDLSGKFPEVVDTIAELKAKDAILDGEIVALDQKGRSSFQLLQAFQLGEERPPIFYYAFDLLRLNGKSLLAEPLHERKAQLEELLQKPPGILRYSASLEGNAKALLQKASKMGLEGLVGKQSDSTYEPGRRSGRWIKLKLHHEQEFVIGGYTDPEGARESFGALLMGYYEKKQLRFCGKVGTGFDTKLLRELMNRFRPLATEQCPFVNLPERGPGRGRGMLGVTEMKRCHWLEPELVCQVKFGEWTRDGKLRQPVFLGLREDKDAREVVREKAK